MELPTVDLVIGSVLIPGDKAPHLITKRHAENDEARNRTCGCSH